MAARGKIIIIIIIIIIELPHSKTILENTVKIEPQPVALDFNILAVPSKTVFWTCAVPAVIPICQSITKLFGV